MIESVEKDIDEERGSENNSNRGNDPVPIAAKKRNTDKLFIFSSSMSILMMKTQEVMHGLPNIDTRAKCIEGLNIFNRKSVNKWIRAKS